MIATFCNFRLAAGEQGPASAWMTGY